MQCAPPVHRLIDDRDIDEANDRQYRAGARAGRGAAHVAAQHEIADIDKPEDQGRGQARIPRPPRTPGCSSPDRAGDQSEGEKHRSQFRCGARDPIPAFIFLPQIDDAAQGHDTKGEHPDDS